MEHCRVRPSNTTGWISFDVTSFVNQALTSGKLVSVGLVDTTIANRTAQFRGRSRNLERACAEQSVKSRLIFSLPSCTNRVTLQLLLQGAPPSRRNGVIPNGPDGL